jgi:two-component system OmpR family sensor kinase
MPIRLRLALLFAAGTALLIGVGGYIFVNELSAGLTNSIAADLESRASFLLATNANGERLGSAFERINAPSGVAEFAQFLSSTGAIVESAGPGSKRILLSRAQIKSISLQGAVIVRNLPGTDDVLLYVVPRPVFVEPQSGTKETLVIGASLGTVDEALDGIERTLVIGGPIAVLLAAVAGHLLAGAALRPVERMRRQAAAISGRDETTALEVPHTDDEIAALARTLNELLARLQGALGRQREFVASAGHELRTPLANLKLELELAQRQGRTSSELREAVHSANEEVNRLARLAESLLFLADSDEATPLVLMKHQDVVAVIAATVNSFSVLALDRGVTLELTAPPATELSFDDLAMRQVIENLLDNALRYAPLGSSILVVVRSESARAESSPAWLVIDVLDEGPGFAPDYLSRAFERFSRPDGGRDRRRGGTGLGLSIVKSLIEAHAGTVQVANRGDGGARVRIRLPMSGLLTARIDGGAVVPARVAAHPTD